MARKTTSVKMTNSIVKGKIRRSSLHFDMKGKLAVTREKMARIISILAISTVMLNACSSNNPSELSSDTVDDNKPTATQTLEQTSTLTIAPTFTATPTPTLTLTPTETTTPTPTPIVEGNIEPFLEEENSNAEIVKEMLILQSSINGYDPESGLDFGQYISSIKEGFENNEEHEHILNMLEDFEGYDKVNTLILARIMQENIPELGIINVDNWSEDRVVDINHPDTGFVVSILNERGLEPGFLRTISIYDGMGILGDISIETFLSGDLVFNTDNFDQSNEESDFTLYIIISKFENQTGTKLLSIAINDGGEMILIVIEEDNIKRIFGENVVLLMGRRGSRNFP